MSVMFNGKCTLCLHPRTATHIYPFALSQELNLSLLGKVTSAGNLRLLSLSRGLNYVVSEITFPLRTPGMRNSCKLFSSHPGLYNLFCRTHFLICPILKQNKNNFEMWKKVLMTIFWLALIINFIHLILSLPYSEECLQADGDFFFRIIGSSKLFSDYFS